MQIKTGYNSTTTVKKTKNKRMNARFSPFVVTAVTLLSLILSN